ncbi:hypothetical protein T484DRAFT_1876788, partial [Baffinella frigidus]
MCEAAALVQGQLHGEQARGAALEVVWKQADGARGVEEVVRGDAHADGARGMEEVARGDAQRARASSERGAAELRAACRSAGAVLVSEVREALRGLAAAQDAVHAAAAQHTAEQRQSAALLAAAVAREREAGADGVRRGVAGGEEGYVRGREEGLRVARGEGEARVEVVVRERTDLEARLLRVEVEVRSMTDALAERDEALRAAGQERDALHLAVAALRADAEEVQSGLRADLHRSQNLLTDADAERERLGGELALAKGEVARGRRREVELEARGRVLGEELEVVRRELRETEDGRSAAEAESTALTEHLATLRERLALEQRLRAEEAAAADARAAREGE